MVPALGTFIRITLELPAEQFASVSDRALAKISELEKKLSFFDPDSEVSQLNRAGSGEWIGVSDETIEVLKLARTLCEDSDGAFSAGNRLIFKGNFVLKTNKESIDLGGIAKGYIVDQAWKVMQAAAKELGMSEVYGSINAGGDLKVHERESRMIPIEAGLANPVFHPMHKSSLATSSRQKNANATAQYGYEKTAFRTTVSVEAEETWLADALTKVALFHPDPKKCFQKWNARLVYEN